MSETPIRRKDRGRSRLWLELTAFGLFVLVPLVYWLAVTEKWFVSDFESVTGSVLETRIVVDHLRENEGGIAVYYRLEAHVTYVLPLGETAGPMEQDRWLTASEVTAERDQLLKLEEKHWQECRVTWIVHHAENARCELIP